MTGQDPDKTKEALGLLMGGLILTQTRALITTLVNEAGTLGREATSEENKELIETYIWRTELDDSVCPDCEELEGVEMDLEDDEWPPLHTNCRCHIEIILK